MTRKPVVLFVCTHNAGRSLAARVLLGHYARGRIDVRSAGSDPADELNPSVVAILRDRGLDPAGEQPKLLTVEGGLAADVVVTMGCGETCPVYPGKRYLDWDLPDPAGQPVDAVRSIVDDIDRRVQLLLAELTDRVTPTDPMIPTRRPVPVPVACTLGELEVAQRLGHWRRALHGLVVHAARPHPGQLRLTLADDYVRVGALVELAKAEKACCSFFDFVLDIGAEALILVVDVSTGNESVLNELARLTTSPP